MRWVKRAFYRLLALVLKPVAVAVARLGMRLLIRLIRGQGRAAARTLAADSARFRQRGQWQSAIVWAKGAVAADPTYAQDHRALGEAYFASGKVDKAQAAFERSAAADPSDPVFPAKLGYLAWERGDRQSAETGYRRALEFAPDEPRYLYGLALVMNFDQSVHALRLMERAHRLAPSDVQILAELGRLYRWQDDPITAERVLGEALDLDPANGRAHYYLAHALVDQDRWPEAINEARRATELAPEAQDFQQFLRELESPLGSEVQPDHDLP